MAEKNDFSGIADDTRPNAGRIYDYFLGGNHNFEIDRFTAQQLINVSPFVPKILRMLRWFLGEATRRLLDEGFTQFLDFASGLPVQDHIHQISPKGTKVLYSDIDPVTVTYAKEIIGENPDVSYLQCDAATPEMLLNSEIVEKMFDKNKKIAIGMSGISYFLPDDKISHTLNTLYNWAEKGYKLFLSESDYLPSSDNLPKANEIFAKMGTPFHWRTQEKMKSLIGKWKAAEPGFQNLEYWLNLDFDQIKETTDNIGGTWYGVILEKQ